MKTAASYIKKKYDCYKGYSEKSIIDVCHIWCEVIEEAQNDVKKEYEEKLRWISVEEKLPEESLDILANLMAPGAARDLRKSLTMACSKAIREESKLILPHHIERYENGETMPWDIVL